MAVTSPDPWASAPELPRAFLLEYRGRAERRALARWVEAARAREGATVLSSVPLAARASDVEPGALARFLESGGDCFLVPLRAVRSGKQHEVVVAEGATLAELSARLAARSGGSKPAADALARFIRRQAVLALERAERNLHGARYKIPRLLEEEVLERPRLLKALAEEAEVSGRSLAAIQKDARKCLHEMAPRFRTRALDLMASLGRYLYTRGFDREVDVLPEDLARVRALSREYPVAFLMTHKSHLDGFLLITLFYDLDLPPVHVFGGINMSFFGLGALGKHSGAIFIRRTMSGDNVYKAVFKQYIDYLAEKRFPLLWALEGTRSRTGKLMPPRYGLINYVVDSYARAAASDMVLMPVSIAYDQVPEVGDYIAEQKGIAKRPESASWFLQYVSGLRNPFGRIHVRFGEGLKLSEVLGEPRPGMQVTPLDVQKIAFRLSVDANAVTPVLGTSLIAWVLCGAGRRALTLSELARELRALTRLVRAMKLPTSGEIEHPTMDALERALGQLVHTGVLAHHQGAREPLYAIAPEATMAAAYYRNAMIHFLVAGAIGELALLAAARSDAGEPRERLHAAALQLRDLLKFEFFFHEKLEFLEELERDLRLRLPDWEAALAGGPRAVQERLAAVAPLLAPGTLGPFLESYLVVAEALLLADAETAANPKGLIRFCMRLAGERALQGRIGSAESAAKVYLENGLLVARARGLAGGAAAASRQEFHDELAGIARDVALLAAMTENRRLGHDAAT